MKVISSFNSKNYQETMKLIETRVDLVEFKQESNEEEAIKKFDIINNNVVALQQWTGKYDPSSYPRFYVMGDGSRFTGGINGYTPIIFHYMEYNLGDGFDVEAGTFYAPKGKTSMR